MKNIGRIISLAIVAVLVFSSIAMAWKEPKWPTQGGTPVESNFGCAYIATPTVGLTGTQSVDLADYLPTQCFGFRLRVTFGDIVLANGGNIATGTFQERIGELVASGSTFSWDGLGGRFTGKVIPNTSTASFTLDLAW